MNEPIVDVPMVQLRAANAAGQVLLLRSIATMITTLPLTQLADQLAAIETFIGDNPEHREVVRPAYEVFDLETTFALLRVRRELITIATNRAEHKDRAARRAARA